MCTSTAPHEQALFDHLFRSPQHRRRDRHAERLCSLEVDHQLELRGLLDGEIAWIGPFQNFIDVGGRTTIQSYEVGTVRHQIADFCTSRLRADRRDSVLDREVRDSCRVNAGRSPQDVQGLRAPFLIVVKPASMPSGPGPVVRTGTTVKRNTEAAAWVSRSWMRLSGFSACRTATRESDGTVSLRSSRRFATSSLCWSEMPVTRPPGRARLVTSPAPIGSGLAMKTTGISLLIFVATCAAVTPP